MHIHIPDWQEKPGRECRRTEAYDVKLTPLN